MSDHERIYLQQGEDPEFGRTWCQNQVESDDTAYMRADLVDGLVAAARTAAERFRKYEAMHAAKPDPVKAPRNADMAVMLEQALAAFSVKETTND